jgi:hypothetical protein
MQAAFVFVTATFAMLLFAAATQGYFLAPSRWWESAALLLVAFTLFVPNFWLERVQPRFETLPATQFEAALDGGRARRPRLRIVVEGPTSRHGARRAPPCRSRSTRRPPDQRLDQTGLFLMPEDDVVMDEPMLRHALCRCDLSGFDFYGADPGEIAEVERPADRLAGAGLLSSRAAAAGARDLLQRRRQTKPAF